jgi:uncharacterized membrane protein
MYLIFSPTLVRRINEGLFRLMVFSYRNASLLDRAREWFHGFPPALATILISMIPIFELRGSIPTGVGMGMKVWEAFLWAVLGNMIPIPFILWFLEPFSDWLSRHSRVMERFFAWLFARTRKKHSRSFERWKEVALMIFVAIPLPMTGAWSGAVAAFVFGIPFIPALLYIFLGVAIAGIVVSLTTATFQALGWQLSLILGGIMVLVLVVFYFYAKKDVVVEIESERQSPDG